MVCSFAVFLYNAVVVSLTFSERFFQIKN